MICKSMDQEIFRYSDVPEEQMYGQSNVMNNVCFAKPWIRRFPVTGVFRKNNSHLTIARVKWYGQTK